MKKVKESGEAIAGVNIVPVIDVTLVLLVVLLVMSPVVNLPSMSVDLPEAITQETKDQNVSVSMSSDGKFSIDDQIVEWEQIPSALRAALKNRKDVVVIVRADRGLPYGAVEGLIKVVNKNAGKWPVAIATRQRTTPLEAH